MKNLVYVIFAVCALHTVSLAESRSSLGSNEKKSVEEMNKIIRQYVSHNDSLWHFSLTHEKAIELGISDSVYFSHKEQLEKINDYIVEQRKKGEKVHLLRDGDTLLYTKKEGDQYGTVTVK